MVRDQQGQQQEEDDHPNKQQACGDPGLTEPGEESSTGRGEGTDGTRRRQDRQGRCCVGPCRAEHDGHDALRERSDRQGRSEEHTSELQSLMRISYAVFCSKTKDTKTENKKTSELTSYITRLK